MGSELDTLSVEAQTAKQAHLVRDSENHAMLERLHYIQAAKQLSSDVERFFVLISQAKASHTLSTLKDALATLKTHIELIYTAARSHSSLADPIGRTRHRTWENTPIQASKSPMKRENALRPDSVGMRLLLPADTIRATLSLLDTISKMCTTTSLSWLDTTENMELVESVASKVAANFSDSSSEANPLLPALSSMELQLPQQLFWLCRTSQELRTLLVGPPPLVQTGNGASRFFSPRSAAQANAQAAEQFIQSFGPASRVFAQYWKQMEDFLIKRFSKLKLPSSSAFSSPSSKSKPTFEQVEEHLQHIHDINARFWVMNKMLWFDTPGIAKQLATSHAAMTLDSYLDIRSAIIDINSTDPELNGRDHTGDSGMLVSSNSTSSSSKSSSSSTARSELPLDVPQLALFSLPHAQIEAIATRFANIVDTMALLPIYESWSPSDSLESSMRSFTQLSLFWANGSSGPWYPLAKSDFPAPTLVLRFLPSIRSLRCATAACARIIEQATPAEKSAYADTTIWTQKKPEIQFFSFLTSCLCMLVCGPGLLAVEDFLLESLSTPLSRSNPKLATNTYRQIQNFLLAPQAEDAHTGSFWTHSAVIKVLDTLKLGQIKTVLLLRLQELLNPKKQETASAQP